MDDPITSVLQFSDKLNTLKYIYRFAATRCKDKDSTAAHTWHLAIMAYTLHQQLSLQLDIEKALKIALVHDIPEIVTGDIDFRLIEDGKTTKDEKKIVEEQAMRELLKGLSPELNKELYDLWQEYETGSSIEGRYIKAIDKLESFSNQFERGPESFDYTHIIVTYADKAIQQFPELKPVLRAVKLRLKERFKDLNIPWKVEYNYAIEE